MGCGRGVRSCAVAHAGWAAATPVARAMKWRRWRAAGCVSSFANRGAGSRGRGRASWRAAVSAVTVAIAAAATGYVRVGVSSETRVTVVSVWRETTSRTWRPRASWRWSTIKVRSDSTSSTSSPAPFALLPLSYAIDVPVALSV